MDKLLSSPAIQQAPLAVAFGLISLFAFLAFLKFVKSQNASQNTFLRQMHAEHLDAREQMRKTIEQNAESNREQAAATTENANATRENTKAIIDLRDMIKAAELRSGR